MTGKSYKLVFEITYNDGEKVYQTEKYVFVKTVAKEKPADQGGQGQPGRSEHGTARRPKGGQQDNSGGGVDTGDSGGTAGDLGGGMVYNSEPMTSGAGAAVRETDRSHVSL